MGLLSGSLTFKIFRLAAELPQNYEADFEKGIKKYRFKPIENDRIDPISIGWVNPLNPVDEIHSIENLLVDEYLVLGLRIDRKTLNKKMFKAHAEKRIEQIKKEKSLKSISKEQKQAIEEEVKMKMLKETSPSTVIIEMAWNLNKGKVYFGSHSKARIENFLEIFAQSFNIEIFENDAYIIAQESARKTGGDSMNKFLAVKSAVFSPIYKKNAKGKEEEEK